MHDLERGLVEAAMERARYNQRTAADLLGLTYDQLRGKLKKHDVPRSPGGQEKAAG
jgi:psp operon transcriptional activator